MYAFATARRPGLSRPELFAFLGTSPDFYPQKLDLLGDSVLFLRFDRARYQREAFLDDRVVAQQVEGVWIDIAEMLQALNSAPSRTERCSFLFHIGHCGSTLMSRLLDQHPEILGLREPDPLRTLAAEFDKVVSEDSLVAPQRFDALLQGFMQMWSRVYDASEQTVVKSTSYCNALADRLMARAPSGRALIMFVDLDAYLAGMLASPTTRLELRAMSGDRMRRLTERAGERRWRLSDMSLGEIAAMNWMVEMSTLKALETPARDGRLLWLDFERFLSRPVATLSEVFAFFGKSADEQQLQNIAGGPVMQRYSKAQEYQYSPQTRHNVLRDSVQRNTDEIERGRVWARETAQLPAFEGLIDWARSI